MTVEDFFLEIICAYMQKNSKGRLEYFSKSENASLGWYFWLKKVAGVYELELEEESKTDNKAEFYLRYYPALEEEVLETYAVEEQLLRFNQKVFDDQPIEITPQDPNEICPCCLAPVNQDDSYVDYHNIHNTTFFPGFESVIEHPRISETILSNDQAQPGSGKRELKSNRLKVYRGAFARTRNEVQDTKRPKGIPQIWPKFSFHKDLFTVGRLSVEVIPKAKTGGLAAYSFIVATREKLLTYAEQPILMLENDKEIELVPSGGINRSVPGVSLCKNFLDFLSQDFLKVVADKYEIEPLSYQTDTIAHQEGNSSEKDIPDMVYMCIQGKERCQNG